MKTGREFIIHAPLGLLGLAAASRIEARGRDNVKPPPGAPGAFNTTPAVGPEVTPTTFAEAGKLEQVTLTAAQREMAAANWRTSMAGMLERRTGPRKIALEEGLAPATVWDPILPGHVAGPVHDRFVASQRDPGPLPAKDAKRQPPAHLQQLTSFASETDHSRQPNSSPSPTRCPAQAGY